MEITLQTSNGKLATARWDDRKVEISRCVVWVETVPIKNHFDPHYAQKIPKGNHGPTGTPIIGVVRRMVQWSDLSLLLVRETVSWPQRCLDREFTNHGYGSPNQHTPLMHGSYHDFHRRLYNTTANIARVHIFSRGQISISFEGHIDMLYRPFSTCTPRACTRSCVWMDGPVSVVLCLGVEH